MQFYWIDLWWRSIFKVKLVVIEKSRNMTNLKRGVSGSWTEESPVTNDLVVSGALLLNPWTMNKKDTLLHCKLMRL